VKVSTVEVGRTSRIVRHRRVVMGEQPRLISTTTMIPAKLVRKIAPGAGEQGPKDRLMGAGYVERALTVLLG
jgi:hypothetical protein